ncbi:MAG TPA: SiaC family regulatory phosphoprotein [Cyclobacteriaceae bacterium]
MVKSISYHRGLTQITEIGDEKDLLITGNLISESAFEFYFPFIETLDNHFLKGNKNLKVFFFVKNISAGASRFIEKVMKRLNQYATKNSNTISIEWYYENDHILKQGNRFKKSSKFLFNLHRQK